MTTSYLTTNYNTASALSSNPPSYTTDLGNFFQLQMPIGSILMYAGGNLPANYLWCDGTSYTTATYGSLYDVIGTTYGSGSSTDTFNVPNFSKFMPIGASDTTNRTISYPDLITAVNADVTSGGNSVITTNQLASHHHGPPSGSGYVFWNNTDQGANVVVGNNGANMGLSNVPGAYYVNNTLPTGLSQEFLPPFVVVNFIIKFV